MLYKSASLQVRSLHNCWQQTKKKEKRRQVSGEDSSNLSSPVTRTTAIANNYLVKLARGSTFRYVMTRSIRPATDSRG